MANQEDDVYLYDGQNIYYSLEDLERDLRAREEVDNYYPDEDDPEASGSSSLQADSWSAPPEHE